MRFEYEKPLEKCQMAFPKSVPQGTHTNPKNSTRKKEAHDSNSFVKNKQTTHTHTHIYINRNILYRYVSYAFFGKSQCCFA